MMPIYRLDARQDERRPWNTLRSGLSYAEARRRAADWRCECDHLRIVNEANGIIAWASHRERLT